jgi:hypothetical protein
MMIKFANQVPSVYPSASRDFQYLCWLIDIVLNSVKHNVDDLYALPDNKADPKLTELLAMTLGFKVKRNYDQSQLRALIAALPRILKCKGTKTAIDMAGNALIKASGASGEFTSEISEGELIVTFPVNLVDISLFTDLLEYILPAGMTYRVVRKNQIKQQCRTELTFDDVLLAKLVPDIDMEDNSEGLANIYEPGLRAPVFANYLVDTEQVSPNIGLLDNSIIPIIASPLHESKNEPVSTELSTGTDNTDKLA